MNKPFASTLINTGGCTGDGENHLHDFESSYKKWLLDPPMQLLDLSLPTPQLNLALDEALIEHAESDVEGVSETLRLWEMPSMCIVMGRGSKASCEVDLQAAKEDAIPVLRRSSGGATVLGGPGCLMYSVLLSYRLRPQLRSLDEAHRFVIGQLHEALRPVLTDVRFEGTCDLTWQGMKFSGNALRCKREFLLYHGTILYDFPLSTISKYLLDPPRQPDYRQKRSHGEFVTNVPVAAAVIRSQLVDRWKANPPAPTIPESLVERLLREKYNHPAWHRVDL